jgi:site-specific recombinase XerD
MWFQREVEVRCRPLSIITLYAGYLNSFVDWLQRQQRLTLKDVTTDSVTAYLRSTRPRLTKGAWNGTRAALWLWTTWLFRQGYLQQRVDCGFDVGSDR